MPDETGSLCLTASTNPVIYARLPNWVGDVCMCLPSLDALLHTGLDVVACARPWAKDLLAAYPLRGFVPMLGHWRSDGAALRHFKKQAQHGVTRGLLLPDSLSSALVFRYAGIPGAGYRDDGRGLMLRWAFRKPAGPLHAVQSWYALTRQALSRWRLPTPAPQVADSLGWRAAAGHDRQAREALHAAGLSDGSFILIAPTATGLHKGRIKVWAGFDALTRALQARDMTVVMAPPPAERAAALAAAPSALCLPSLGLGAFAALTRHAAMVVCNDSGVSHLAAAAQARQITLFGVTDPSRTGPWSPQAHCLGHLNAWPSLDEILPQVLHTLDFSPSP